MRAVLTRCLLVAGSLALGLALCEAVLRLAYPRYEHLTKPPPLRQGGQEPWRTSGHTMKHPDAEAWHRVAYGNLGGRQHRDFSERDLRDGVNVAFFGDSFTENYYLAAPYSFTEVLDYLLNRRTAEAPARAETPAFFNVLNFGIRGTGPHVQYDLYRRLQYKDSLRHVFYVHCFNDLDDLQVDIRRAGGLLGDPFDGENSAWRRWLSRLHLAYLVVDVWQRRAARAARDRAGDAVRLYDSQTLSTFRSLVLRWREEVEAAGGAFHVVLLPVPGTARQFREVGWPPALQPLDLAACFDETFPDRTWEDWRLTFDPHWNEAANMVAAHCLYRFLEGRLGLGAVSDEALARARHTYYRAFAADAAWQGRRFMPTSAWAVPGQSVDGPLPPQGRAAKEAAAIRAKYLGNPTDPRRRFVREVRQNAPRVRAAGWEVYAAPEHRLLLYARPDCDEPHPASRLFLHAFAANSAGGADDSSAGGRHGRRRFQKIRLTDDQVWRFGRECVVTVYLRSKAVVKVRTGEKRARGGQVLWQEEFRFDSPESVASALASWRRELRAYAARPPDARAAWDLYAEGRRLTFLQDPCTPGDLHKPFFLRLWRADAAAHRGYREHLFEFKSDASVIDGKCLLRRLLPDQRIDAITAGQYEAGRASVLWQATLILDAGRFDWAGGAPGAVGDAAGAFAVHHRGSELIYVREPCVRQDVQAHFFLHAFGETAAAEPSQAFHNLDFDFNDWGIRDGGRCVAVRPLPARDIVRIRTGQFVPGEGAIWAVEISTEEVAP